MLALAAKRGGRAKPRAVGVSLARLLTTPERRRKGDFGYEITARPAELGDLHTHDQGRVTVLRVTDQSPADILRAKGILTEPEHRAAEEFHRHWYQGGLSPSCTSAYAEGIPLGDHFGCGMPVTERQVHFRERFREAAAELQSAGRVTAAYTLAIVLDQRSPADVGTELSGRADPAQARAVAIDRLREGLACLASHFGFVKRGRH